ncbi:MAG: triple tyrosine motif-containing protein [Pseudomonadota bacterium]
MAVWRFRRACAIAAAVALPLFAPPGLRAQVPGYSLDHFRHSRWTQDDGAPPGISGLAQTPDGYLWVASQRGLFRFDGVAFEEVASATQSDAGGAIPTALLVTRAGQLWVGYGRGQGVATLRDGALVDAAMPDAPPQITMMVEGPDGAIWAVWGGMENRLARFRDGRWEKVDWADGLQPGLIVSLLRMPDGTILASMIERGGARSMLLALPPGARRFHALALPVSTTRLAVDASGNLWGADRDTTRMMLGAGRATLPSFPAVPDLRLATLVFDRWGGLWGTTRSTGLFHIAAPDMPAARATGAVERMRATAGLTSDVTSPALVDREGNIWIGSDLGLDQFRRVNMVRESAIPADPVAGLWLASTPGGTVYVASSNSLFEIAPHAAPRRVQTGIRDITALCPARDGGIWLIQYDHILNLGPSGRREVPLPGRPMLAYGCAQDRHGRLWIANQGGMHWHDARGWHAGKGRMASEEIWDLVADPDGDIAFTINLKTLVRVRGNHVRYLAPARIGIGNISTLASVGGRDLLVSGARGLARLRGDEIRRISGTRAPWLANARGIVQAADGSSWFLGVEGVSRVSTAALNRAFEDEHAPLDRLLFDNRDGLPGSTQHPGFRGAQAGATGDGRIWFLNRAGVVYVDGRHLIRNRVPPPVTIRAIATRDSRFQDPSSVSLAAGTRAVTIAYSALSLAVPDRVAFRYRLDGVDEDWVDPGPRREASYANLRPGSYRFRVIAANDAGVWNRTGATLDFVIRPTFFESWLFKLLCATAILALLWCGYALRLRTAASGIRSRMAERMAERERIARELHDTLLQSIQALILRFQLVADEIPPSEPARVAMEEALDQADALLAEGRDRVRGLRPVGAVTDFEALLLGIARRQAFDLDVDIVLTSEGEIRTLDPMAADEVVRIANEALFNIWRHARATRVEIRIAYRPGAFQICFCDNGVGIDPAIAAAGRDGHFGLAGMRERARKLQGDLLVGPLREGGTQVTLTVPAAIAYAAGKNAP